MSTIAKTCLGIPTSEPVKNKSLSLFKGLCKLLHSNLE